MRTVYDSNLHAQVTYDDQDRVRQITHLDAKQQPSLETLGAAEDTESLTARDVARAYIERIAPLLEPAAQLEATSESASHVEPMESPVQYRVTDESTLIDATTVGFAQTVNQIPVWESGISVLVKHNPYRVVSADTNTAESVPAPKMPPEEVVARYRELFNIAAAEQRDREGMKRAGLSPAEMKKMPWRTTEFVQKTLGAVGDTYMIRGRFFIYRYDPEARIPDLGGSTEHVVDAEGPIALPFTLPSVPVSIQPYEFYLVAEITFSHRELVWLALVELETAAVLYLRPMFAAVNGMVFRVDPLTATGLATNTANQPNSVLNPLRTSVVLPNLDAPSNGTQQLNGSHARLADVHIPTIAAPTRPTGTDFDFNVRTNNFAAVNAYYHVEQFFETVLSLGFPLTYFKNTTFPVDVDHRAEISGGTGGIEINAHCVDSGTGGIGHVCFALGDLNDTTNPVGRACDSRVFWHELGGHGVLYGYVNSPNFKFAHSAGDALSAIFHAPDSNASGTARGRYAPWNPQNTRRFDHSVSSGFAWGGVRDKKMLEGGYPSEEILATTLFRAYQSIGGASTDIARRRFASRMMIYLILTAIGTLKPQTNPDHAMKFANTLVAADLIDWTTENIFGGAYGKVIRWAFEKQGLYQPAGAPTPVTTAGAPPDVDVYIDDSRNGEYQFLPDHTNTTTIWNRHAPDNNTTHQQPLPGVTNHAYVMIGNRGSLQATGVRVRAFHSRAGVGLVWPNDFQPMTTPVIAVGTVAGNTAPQQIVGPFAWTPIMNQAGGDAMLMIISANEDPSNADNFSAPELIEDWRLVPNDNGIAMRRV